MNTGTIILFSLVIILALIIFGYAFNVMVLKGERLQKLFKELSVKYDFKLDLTKKHASMVYPQVNGSYRNRNIEIGTFDKSDEGKPVPHTYIKLSSMSNTDFSFIIQKRTRKNKFYLTREEVVIEDDEFNKAFIVQANAHDLMKNIMDYTIRFKLIQSTNVGYKGEMLLLGGEMLYIESGVINNKNDLLRIELLMHSMCDITDDIEHYTVVPASS